MTPLRSLPRFGGWHHFLAIVVLLFGVVATPAVVSRGDEKPGKPLMVTYRIRGLFCPEREEELRGLWKAELPAIKVLEVDSLSGEATFEFDPVVALGPNAKAATAEKILSLFNGKVKEASQRKYPRYPSWQSVFTAVPSSPPETLQYVEIPLEGLDCAACALAFHETLVKFGGVAHAQVSFGDGRAIVLVDPEKFDEFAVRGKLAEQHAGGTMYEMSAGVRRERKINATWRRRPAVPRPDASAGGKKSAAEASVVSTPAEALRFVTIPGGTYGRGNASGDNDFSWSPVQKVTLGGFRVAVTLTTKAQWDSVRSWATSHGYTDLPRGEGRAGDHPVHSVTWYDVVKWCNAASEKDDLTPCYKAGGEVYRQGTPADVSCDWQADGYRLPTEAEWEVAARGGLVGKRFPWGDTISHDQANYLGGKAAADMPFDKSGNNAGYHPKFAAVGEVCTSPVGSFPANGYGLFDMAGNASHWCWDWFGQYGSGPDPRGPNTGAFRMVRGGHWASSPLLAASAIRVVAFPTLASTNVGFRVARRQITGAEGRSSSDAGGGN